MANIIRFLGISYLIALGTCAFAQDEEELEFTDAFMTEECSFTSEGNNPYFLLPLEIGRQATFEGEDDGEILRVVISVLDETFMVGEVETRIVEEREWVDDELFEVSRNYFAICEETNDVFYFGEAVDIYEDGIIVSHDGAWLAGENEAEPGIFTPGTILLGSRHLQEVAPDIALDQVEITNLTSTISTPAGTFENVMETRETTPLDPETVDFKYYYPGIGMVKDGPLDLVSAVPALEGGLYENGFNQTDEEFTTDFWASDCTFSPTGINPYFNLTPGYQLLLEGEDEEGATVTVLITVLDETKEVDGVETRIIEEMEWEDEDLIEISRNYYAICAETNSVFYFGEEVDIYEDGVIVSHDGAWEAGVDGATAGIIMPGTAFLGAKYFQEIAPELALDRAEITSIDEELETPAGTFEDLLETVETTPLEPGEESLKLYAPGVGLVLDDFLLLVEATSGQEFTDTFTLEDCTFTSEGNNPYFLLPLEVGRQATFEGEDDGESLRVVITVLDETFMVGDVETRIVEEREWADDELTEVSRNYFAICVETNDVYYFGEAVDDYEDGVIVSHDGAWLTGVDDAEAGIFTPGTVTLGARHFQEVAPGVALDQVEITGLSATVETPAGTFENAMETTETTPLDPGVVDLKFYFPGIGMVKDGPLDLVSTVPALPTEFGGGFDQTDEEFTTDFRQSDCTFSTAGRNPYFILSPGYQLNLEGEEDGATITVQITVLDETMVVDGVETRIIEEREWEDEELIEISRNYYAICNETNSVFYFGEEVDNFEDGVLIDHGGSWEAGVDGSKAGVIMPGTALLGSKYFQEIAPGEALDRAEITSLDEVLETPAGTFEDSLETVETTPLDPEEESSKLYAPGVGLIFDDILFLVEASDPKAEALSDYFPQSEMNLFGWSDVSWFGSVQGDLYPWIYHNDLGWLFAAGDGTDSFYFWDATLGWVWTSPTNFPWFWSFSDNDWLYYAEGTTNPRWFYSMNTGQWAPAN